MGYQQSNTQASEELAALLSRNLTFQQPSQQLSEPQPIQYSISQHYHHSAHIAHKDEPVVEPQPSSPVLAQAQPSAEQVLSQHGIDPSRLSSQQIDLFKTADTPQQTRLVALWQICPPTSSVTITSTNSMTSPTSGGLYYTPLMSLDGTPLTPVQSSDGHWVNMADSEPYMTSGYEMLARREYEESAKRQLEEELLRPKEVYSHFGSAVVGNNDVYRPATDPVYANDWSQQQQAMENQYGAYQQMDCMEF